MAEAIEDYGRRGPARGGRGLAGRLRMGDRRHGRVASRPRGAGGAGSRAPTALSMCRIWRKPTCCWPRTMPRMKAGSPPPWPGSAARHRRFITSTPPAPTRPRARTLPEEIARVVRARAANPNWADGMMRHGFRGAAEIAATLDHMAAFAHLARAVPRASVRPLPRRHAGPRRMWSPSWSAKTPPRSQAHARPLRRACATPASGSRAATPSRWGRGNERADHPRLVPRRAAPDDVGRRACRAGAPARWPADARSRRAGIADARRAARQWPHRPVRRAPTCSCAACSRGRHAAS